MFPKIAAVLGAHTELGKRVVTELLRSPYVAKVHALAEVDPRDAISIRPRDQRKLALHIDPLDYIEDTVVRHINQCNIAFCVLGGGKKDMAAMGAYKFHKTNLDIPSRFIHEMFALRVERIAVLSHIDASRRARASEFSRVKWELESTVRHMQNEAADHAPGVTIFKLPLILTNLRDASGIRGTSITTIDKVKQKAAVKMDLSPAHAVHVRDVAMAMVADMFHKLHVTEASSDIEPIFRRRDIRYQEIVGQRVVNLARRYREMRQEQKSTVREQRAYDHRVSGYARRHTQRGSVGETSVHHDHSQPEGSARPSDTPSEQWNRNVDDSRESYMSGTPPDEDVIYDDDIYYNEERLRAAAYSDRSSTTSRGKSQGPASPAPSSEPRHFEESGSRVGSGSFQSPGRRKTSRGHVTSVDALGDQLGRRLTVIRDNEYLPDTDSRPLQPSQGHYLDLHVDQELSAGTDTGTPKTPEFERDMVQEFADTDFSDEIHGASQPFHDHTNFPQSPPLRSPSFDIREDFQVPHLEVQQESPVWYPEIRRNEFDSPPQRYSTASHRSPSYSRRYPEDDVERYSGENERVRPLRRVSDYRGGIRSERDGSRPSSLLSRVTEFAERVIAATDRPSMRQSSRGRSRFPLGGDERSLPSRNADSQLVGNTAI